MIKSTAFQLEETFFYADFFYAGVKIEAVSKCLLVGIAELFFMKLHSETAC